VVANPDETAASWTCDRLLMWCNQCQLPLQSSVPREQQSSTSCTQS
jgi:hypothetical protein